MTATYAEVAHHTVAVANGWIRKADETSYTQTVRRWSGINGHILSPHVPPEADCSSAIAWLFWDARIHVRGHAGPDILNGLDWRAGNTDSMIRHGHRHKLGVAAWIPGRTCLFYGGPRDGSDPTHTTLYLGASDVFTMGSTPDPKRKRWNYRSDFRMAIAYRT